MTEVEKIVMGRLGNLDITIDSYPGLIKASLQNYRQVVDMVVASSKRGWKESIGPLEEAAERLDSIWGMLEQMNSVAKTDAVRDVYEELLPVVTNFHTELLQDARLYEVYAAVAASEEFADLELAQRKIIENQLRDFKLSGVSLPEQQRDEYKKLAERLSGLENIFANNLLDATEGWSYVVYAHNNELLRGLPGHTIARALELGKQRSKESDELQWVLTLDQPCYMAIMSYAESRELRREFYMAYTTRASDQGPNRGKWDNTPIISEILAIRRKLANLVGYSNYAEYSLVPKMASSIQEVQDFLELLVSKVKPYAEQDIKQLTEFAGKHGAELPLEPWDITYYAELYRKELYDFSEEELRAYFPQERVLNGLFSLVRRVFGLEIVEVPAPLKWDPLVRLFKVTNDRNELSGYFFIDLYARDGKRGGAWMSECLTRMRFSSGHVQHPVAFLTCNFTPPSSGHGGWLLHDEVVTLFHEFGHTLHHILTKVDYYSVSGINGVEWDAVELPSQFMENWCWQWDVLQELTQHMQTKEPLPKELYERMLQARNYNAGLFLARQIEFGLFDLLVHIEDGAKRINFAHEILNKVRDRIAVIKPPSFNRFENSFSHIFAGGYAAGYYSYLWAEVLSCDVFEVFHQNGLYNREVGNKFITSVLEKGGSTPAKEFFYAFTGREPNVEALLRHYGI